MQTVGVGMPGVLLQSSSAMGGLNTQGEFLFSEAGGAGEGAFKFEDFVDEGSSPVFEMEDVSGGLTEHQKQATEDKEDVEEIHLDLSSDQEGLPFEPGLDLEAVSQVAEGLELDLDIPTAEPLPILQPLVEERELELTAETEAGLMQPVEVVAETEEPIRTLEESDLEEELSGLDDKPLDSSPETQKEAGDSLIEEGIEELSLEPKAESQKPADAMEFGAEEMGVDGEEEGLLQVSDLEEDLAGLIDKPIVVMPESKDEAVFDLAEEKLEELSSLETDSKQGPSSNLETTDEEEVGGIVHVSDLEAELSELVDEPPAIPPDAHEEPIFDLSDEALADQSLTDLSLEELGKDEIFQSLGLDDGELSLTGAPGDVDDDNPPVVDLDLDLDADVDIDLAELTRDVEHTLRQLSDETEVFMSDKEILASIPDEPKG
jgi:hypothetical protein